MIAGQRRSRPRDWSIADFSLGEILGEGRYGRVIHAVMKQPNYWQQQQQPQPQAQEQEQEQLQSSTSSPSRPAIRDHPEYHVAIKILDKSYLVRTKQMHAALRERKILTALTTESLACSDGGEPLSVFVPRLLMSFVDPFSVFIVTELCDGGSLTDLVQHIRKGVNDENVKKWEQYLRYISAQLLCGIEFLHFRGCILHRDLKPQNTLLLSNGRVRIIDFGSAIHLQEANTASGADDKDFVGTADFVAPEMLRGFSAGAGTGTDLSRRQTPALDLWSYGCIIHFMFAGRSPFHANGDHLAMQRVLAHSDGSVPIEVDPSVPTDAKDLVARLLVNEPYLRLGYKDIIALTSEEEKKVNSSEIKDGTLRYVSIWEHKFFVKNNRNLGDNGASEPPCVPPTPSWVERYESGETHLIDGATVENDLDWRS